MAAQEEHRALKGFQSPPGGIPSSFRNQRERKVIELVEVATELVNVVKRVVQARWGHLL